MSESLPLFDSLAAEVMAMPGGIKPRDYQAAAIERTFRLFESGSPGVIVRQPTGTGKTVVGTLIADRWLKQGANYRVLWLAHEKQLIWQAAEEVRDILKHRPGIEMADEAVNANRMPKIVVASRASLYQRQRTNDDGTETVDSRLFKFDCQRWNWLVIIDEVHRWLSSMKSCRHIIKWFAQNPLSRRLGLTATPERGDKKTLAKIVPDVAADYPLYDPLGGPNAVDDGWAVPYDQRFVVVEGVDFTTLREVAKDFDKHELEAILGERSQLLKLVQPTLDLVGARPTIIFCPTVNMAKSVAQTINESRPDQAVALDGTTPDFERAREYRRFEQGEFQFLVVCGLCREGYNNPSIGAVAVFRPTKSRGLAEQMKGRGCRPLRGLVDGLGSAPARRAAIAASAKPNCMIVDLVGITGFADAVTTAEILARGLPDVIVERANRNALLKGGPLDMAEELKAAQRQIDEEEKEKARLEQIERERREAERAERAARLKANVRYQTFQLAQGEGRHREQPTRQARMLWGKHRGRPIADVPRGYLRWYSEQNIPDYLKSAIQRHLDGHCDPAPSRQGNSSGSLDDVNRLFQECALT